MSSVIRSGVIGPEAALEPASESDIEHESDSESRLVFALEDVAEPGTGARARVTVLASVSTRRRRAAATPAAAARTSERTAAAAAEARTNFDSASVSSAAASPMLLCIPALAAAATLASAALHTARAVSSAAST